MGTVAQPTGENKMFHADLNDHIMQCSNTAALQQKTMTDRDATAEELAEQDAAKLERAKELVTGKGFALEAISEGLPDSYFAAIGLMSLNELELDSTALHIAVGRRILTTIKDYAMKCAGEA